MYHVLSTEVACPLAAGAGVPVMMTTDATPDGPLVITVYVLPRFGENGRSIDLGVDDVSWGVLEAGAGGFAGVEFGDTISVDFDAGRVVDPVGEEMKVELVVVLVVVLGPGLANDVEVSVKNLTVSAGCTGTGREHLVHCCKGTWSVNTATYGAISTSSAVGLKNKPCGSTMPSVRDSIVTGGCGYDAKGT